VEQQVYVATRIEILYHITIPYKDPCHIKIKVENTFLPHPREELKKKTN